MTIIRRLPVYAAGLGFAAALLAVAEARDWSGWELLGASVAVGTFYVLTILVPWLIREQVTAYRPETKPPTNGGRFAIAVGSHGVLAVLDDDNGWIQVSRTDDPLSVVKPSPPHAVTR